MNKDRIIKSIEENFEDMQDALVENGESEYVRLFREYTDEIIKIIEKEQNQNMEERKYKVIDELGHCIASDMDLEMALLFMKAYCQEYYNERIKLRLELIIREPGDNQ